MKKIIASIAGAVASFYAARFVTQLLSEKPLKTRIREAKTKVIDLKDQASSKITSVKNAASSKVSSLIEEKKPESSHPENDA
jgi:hypothetical protein